MAVVHPAFQRAFPRRELFRGRALRAVLLFGLATLLAIALLLDLHLLVDLAVTRGAVEVAGSEAADVAALAGRTPPDPAPAVVRWGNAGLLPAVLRARGFVWGPPLEALYRGVPGLQRNRSTLALLTAVALVLGMGHLFLLAAARRKSGQAAAHVAKWLRKSLHRQTLRLGPGDLSDTRGREAFALFTDDADRVRDGVQAYVTRMGSHPFALSMLLLLVLAIDWLLALQCLIPLLICWVLIERQQRHTRALQALDQTRAEAELRLLAESLAKTRLVRGYGMEAWEHEQFERHLDRFGQSVASARRRERLSAWGTRSLAFVVAAVVLFLMGAKLLVPPNETGAVAPASAFLMLVALASMYLPLSGLARLQGEIEPAALAADRIHRYLDRIPEVGQAVGAKFLQPLARSLRFESVTWRTKNGRALLDGFDLTLEAGKTYALISLDPLEARAACYLLPRFIEPHAGRVLFDSEDTAWVTLESLRAETIYVGGADPFFTGTVRENISGGHDGYSLQDVTEAAKQTHANKFILSLPSGYETMLGEHGEQLDAGQAFRLGLARAALRNPALLIIEEPTEPIDDDTKALLDDAYSRLVPGRTVIFLPARMATLRRAGRIALIHRGKVEAFGPHAELVRKSPLYRHWEYVRFNVFRHEAESAGVEA
ncbi:MAG: ABC transporter ATP-binding protein/permease [Planctomycetes bacterium]|nr:ABC transporter ATP-binding protein/permease [Planctomycetota bacterium]